mmetsp:Transcript_29405/g.70641  ORF Transcript_29405/g.70641 Transcript_29405/m.70641 type:complete len:243 (+) Transcript_29405:1241-1969(+)
MLLLVLLVAASADKLAAVVPKRAAPFAGLIAAAERAALVVVGRFEPVPGLAVHRRDLLVGIVYEDRKVLAGTRHESAEGVFVGEEGKLDEPAVGMAGAVLKEQLLMCLGLQHLGIAAAGSLCRGFQLLAVCLEVQLELVRDAPDLLLPLPLELGAPPPHQDLSQLIGAIGLNLRGKFLVSLPLSLALFLLLLLRLLILLLLDLVRPWRSVGRFHQRHVLPVLDHPVAVVVGELEKVNHILGG